MSIESVVRKCSGCKQEKQLEDFCRSKDRPLGRSYYCRVCSAHSMRQWKYGITAEEFEQLVAKQQGRCAICLRERELTVDHDHETGRMRGLLCRPCNRCLGQIGETVETFRRIVSYLEQA